MSASARIRACCIPVGSSVYLSGRFYTVRGLNTFPQNPHASQVTLLLAHPNRRGIINYCCPRNYRVYCIVGA